MSFKILFLSNTYSTYALYCREMHIITGVVRLKDIHSAVNYHIMGQSVIGGNSRQNLMQRVERNPQLSHDKLLYIYIAHVCIPCRLYNRPYKSIKWMPIEALLGYYGVTLHTLNISFEVCLLRWLVLLVIPCPTKKVDCMYLCNSQRIKPFLKQNVDVHKTDRK